MTPGQSGPEPPDRGGPPGSGGGGSGGPPDAWDGGVPGGDPGDGKGPRPGPPGVPTDRDPGGADAWSKAGWPAGYSRYDRDRWSRWYDWSGDWYGDQYYAPLPHYGWYGRPSYHYGPRDFWYYDPWWGRRYPENDYPENDYREYNYYYYGDDNAGDQWGGRYGLSSGGGYGPSGEAYYRRYEWVDERLDRTLRDIALAFMVEDIELLAPYVSREEPVYVQYDWDQKRPWVLAEPVFLRQVEDSFADQSDASFWFEELDRLEGGVVWAAGRHVFQPAGERRERDTYLQFILRRRGDVWTIEAVAGDPDDYRWLQRERLDQAMETSADYFEYLAEREGRQAP